MLNKKTTAVIFGALCMALSGCHSVQEVEQGGDVYVRGADIGWITDIENRGTYKLVDTLGNEREAHEILKQLDVNAIRIRVWVNPKDTANGMPYCGIEDATEKAVRAKAAGMDVMIDFHYSNWWADPSKQYVPAEWHAEAVKHADSLSVICDSVEAHTVQMLESLRRAGVEPKWIQVGNEVAPGFMHPYGHAYKQPEGFAKLFKRGYEACKKVFPKAICMVHVDNGYNLQRTTCILDTLRKYGARFDMLGWSLYPAMNWVTGEADPNWQPKVDACLANADSIHARYGVECMLVEVGMPDKDELIGRDCIRYIIDHSGEHIHGLMWWEPLATPDFHYSMGALKQYDGNRYGPNEALKAFAIKQ